MIKKLGIILLVLVVLLLGYRFINQPRPAEDSLRQTASGPVIGTEEGADTFAWKGIPFAAPPVGELRWAAPRPVQAWQQPLEALEHDSGCVQMLPFSWPKEVMTLGSEDCLYLSVWTPKLSPQQLSEADLPVMMFIHGGANTGGMISLFEGHNLAGTQDVMVVSIQYRLGLLGWFSHPALRETAATELDASPNFANLDMVAGLEWVKANAAAFGGNPDNVTIFGESAGGFNVMSMVASPKAKGLFHKAISQSGNIQTLPQVLAENYFDDQEPGLPYSAKEFINRLLIADGRAADRNEAKQLQDSMPAAEMADYLRGKSPIELFSVAEKRGSLGYTVAHTIRDGLVLPREGLLELFADPTQYNSVPMILGSNRDEYKMFMWDRPEFVDKKFGLIPQLIDEAFYDWSTGYFSDQWRAIGVNEPAAVLAQSQPGEIFGYRLDWDQQKTIAGFEMDKVFGAAHAIGVTFLFGTDAVSTLPMYAMAKDLEERADFERSMRSYWRQFAATGDPGVGATGDLPEWQAWRAEGNNKLVLDSRDAAGIYMTDERLSVADLKQRIVDDPRLPTTRDKCEKYAQLFWHSLTVDHWDQAEYEAMGCADYPRDKFSGPI